MTCYDTLLKKSKAKYQIIFFNLLFMCLCIEVWLKVFPSYCNVCAVFVSSTLSQKGRLIKTQGNSVQWKWRWTYALNTSNMGLNCSHLNVVVVALTFTLHAWLTDLCVFDLPSLCICFILNADILGVFFADASSKPANVCVVVVVLLKRLGAGCLDQKYGLSHASFDPTILLNVGSALLKPAPQRDTAISFSSFSLQSESKRLFQQAVKKRPERVMLWICKTGRLPTHTAHVWQSGNKRQLSLSCENHL